MAYLKEFQSVLKVSALVVQADIRLFADILHHRTENFTAERSCDFLDDGVEGKQSSLLMPNGRKKKQGRAVLL